MKINKIVAVFVTTAFALSIAKPVFAEETNQEQELEQKCEVVCEVGAYGQDTTCTNQCYQYGKQIQTITLADGTVIKPHAPIDTGLDTKTSAVATGLMVTGILATVARKKLMV